MYQRATVIDVKPGHNVTKVTQTNRGVSVIVVDEHPVTRLGVTKLLEQHSDVRVVGETSGISNAWKLIQKLCPDILVCDIEFDDGSLFKLLSQVRTKSIHEHTRIVLYTAQDTPELITRALQAGVDGIVHKGSKERRLSEAVRAVADGETYLDPRRHILRGETDQPTFQSGSIVAAAAHRARARRTYRTCIGQTQQGDCVRSVHFGAHR